MNQRKPMPSWLVVILSLIAVTVAALILTMSRASADPQTDNCVDRELGMRLCRNPDNTLTMCSFSGFCRVVTPELMPMLPPGPMPPPAPGYNGSAYRQPETGPAISQNGAAPAVFKTDPPQCVPKWWYSVCVDDQNHWTVCNFNHDGQCYPVPAPPAPIPGLPAPAPAGYRADVPGVNDLICQELRLGYTPGQIADMLRRGDPRWSECNGKLCEPCARSEAEAVALHAADRRP